jgi:hypothetical protein
VTQQEEMAALFTLIEARLMRRRFIQQGHRRPAAQLPDSQPVGDEPD